VSNEQDDVVECEVHIDARPEIVFQYFLDPERIARWSGTVLALDPRPGGEIRVAMSSIHPGSGQIVEVDPPRRLVYTWGWEEPGHPIPPGSTRVEIDLTPAGDGTHLRLRHLGLPADALDDHRAGWQFYVDRLAILASGGDPGPDPTANPTQPTTPVTHTTPGTRS
jgi:uncharacterized protein YndB with AHSA1/START domain